MDTFANYREMKNQCATPRQVYLTPKADGHRAECTRIL